MKKVGRNDPCPCGSGRKYKQCCLRAKEAKTARAADDRSEAVPRAIRWLMSRHGRGVRQALDEGFFGTLNGDEYERLQVENAEVFQGIMVNAMEWLLADGSLLTRGREHRVAELLLGRGGPLFSAGQRQWLELLTSTRLGLYEVVDLVPGESLLLRDILFPQQAPVLVREKSGSRDAAKLDLIAARILPVDDHHELSGAVYSIPRHRSLDLIAELRHELEGLGPDSPEVKEILSVIIPAHWLEWFARPFEMGMLSQTQPDAAPEIAMRDAMPSEVIGEVIERRIRQLYADWADQPLPALNGRTPREAIDTPEGLEQVRFLLQTYEHGEIQQAKTQRRPAVSYEFLWHELGLNP